MDKTLSRRLLLVGSILGLILGVLIAALNVYFPLTLVAIALAVLSLLGLAKYDWETGPLRHL